MQRYRAVPLEVLKHKYGCSHGLIRCDELQTGRWVILYLGILGTLWLVQIVVVFRLEKSLQPRPVLGRFVTKK